ncbi:MAG TPA: pyrroloquinoline-quinone synthase PqqC [Chloroflexota bacterium]|nr:pyrroloquinoline-quinone synthase PqqC [Chloroflexota bacterium]
MDDVLETGVVEAAAPLTSDAFVDALRAQSQRYHHKHPFHVLMNEGRLSRAQIQGWVANRFYYQKSIPIKDAAILSNTPDPAIRRRWIVRIVDHDGAAEGQGGIEAWLRLAEAVGLSRPEVLEERHVVPGVRFAGDAYVTFARTCPWIEAVAASLTELFAPDLMSERIAAFERYYTWVDPAGLAYFKARLQQAPRDATYALDLVTRYCRTREQQERAIAALSFKCDVLWSMLDAIHHAYAQ